MDYSGLGSPGKKIRKTVNWRLRNGQTGSKEKYAGRTARFGYVRALSPAAPVTRKKTVFQYHAW